MLFRIAGGVLVLLLAGCDPFYGVESRTKLANPVDVRCVNAALAKVPEAGAITYQNSEDRSTELLPRRREVLTITHVWQYGEDGGDILQINQTSDGWDYRNSRSRMGVAVPHEEMVRFVPLMAKVNVVIQSRCGLPVANLRAEPVGVTKSTEI
jgi:hypothetical protein